MSDQQIENTYKTNSNEMLSFQGIITNFAFINKTPQKELTLNGIKVSNYFKNNSNIIRIFDLPINITNPNGSMLLKLSQLPEFKNDVQYARLFCLSFQENNKDIKVGLYQHYIYHKILPKLIVDEIKDKLIYFIYQTDTIIYKGKLSDIVMQLYGNTIMESDKWYDDLRQQSQQSSYTNKYIGYSIPEYKIYQEFLQKKDIANITQNLYLKQSAAKGEIQNYISICNYQVVNIIDSIIENLNISQSTNIDIQKQQK